MNALPEPESVKRAHRRQRAAMLAVLPVDRPDLRDALESIIEEDGMTWEAIGSEIAGLLSAMGLLVKEGDLWVASPENMRKKKLQVKAAAAALASLGSVDTKKRNLGAESRRIQVLRAISESGGGVTTKDLTERLGFGVKVTSQAIQDLSGRGMLATLGRSDGARRGFLWTITKGGRDLLQSVDHAWRRR